MKVRLKLWVRRVYRRFAWDEPLVAEENLWGQVYVTGAAKPGVRIAPDEARSSWVWVVRVLRSSTGRRIGVVVAQRARGGRPYMPSELTKLSGITLFNGCWRVVG